MLTCFEKLTVDVTFLEHGAEECRSASEYQANNVTLCMEDSTFSVALMQAKWLWTFLVVIQWIFVHEENFFGMPMEESSHTCFCTVGPYNVLFLHRNTVQAEFRFHSVNRCIRTVTQSGVHFGRLKNQLFHRNTVTRTFHHVTLSLHCLSWCTAYPG